MQLVHLFYFIRSLFRAIFLKMNENLNIYRRNAHSQKRGGLCVVSTNLHSQLALVPWSSPWRFVRSTCCHGYEFSGTGTIQTPPKQKEPNVKKLQMPDVSSVGGPHLSLVSASFLTFGGAKSNSSSSSYKNNLVVRIKHGRSSTTRTQVGLSLLWNGFIYQSEVTYEGFRKGLFVYPLNPQNDPPASGSILVVPFVPPRVAAWVVNSELSSSHVKVIHAWSCYTSRRSDLPYLISPL